MCGSEATIRIERVDNGFTVDAYTPGGKDKPGRHKRSVATTAAHVLHAVGSHLSKSGEERRGLRVRGGGAQSTRVKEKAKRKKKAAFKR